MRICTSSGPVLIDFGMGAFDKEEVWSAYSVSLWVKTDVFAQGQWKTKHDL